MREITGNCLGGAEKTSDTSRSLYGRAAPTGGMHPTDRQRGLAPRMQDLKITRFARLQEQLLSSTIVVSGGASNETTECTIYLLEIYIRAGTVLALR